MDAKGIKYLGPLFTEPPIMSNINNSMSVVERLTLVEMLLLKSKTGLTLVECSISLCEEGLHNLRQIKSPVFIGHSS